MQFGVLPCEAVEEAMRQSHPGASQRIRIRGGEAVVAMISSAQLSIPGGRSEKSTLKCPSAMQMRQFLMSPPMSSHYSGAGSGNEMLKKWFIAAIGKSNYVTYITFLTDLYHSACLPFKAAGSDLIRHYLIPRGGTVLDIGANTGSFTALAAPRVGPAGRVYSFEPVAAAFRVLKYTVALRRLRQVTLIEAALSNRTGVAEITIPLKQGWKPQLPIAYLGGPLAVDAKREVVRVLRLDAFADTASLDRIDLIKCDTEGHEYFVFAGGLKTLARYRPTIFCEISARYLARHDLTPAAVFDLLRPLGYQSYLPTASGYLVPAPTYQGEADYFFLHPDTAKTLDPQFRQRILRHAPNP
jgi:FkbM family methyltransferase